MKIITTTTPRILKTLSQSALSPGSLLLTISIFLFLFWTTKSYATDCCPDFIIKDLVEICPPGGACEEGDDADGHHQLIPAACQESIHTYTAYPNDPSLYTYEWTVVGGTPANFTGNPIDIEWGNGNKGYITLVITGTNGCEATITEEICLIDGPDANFSFNPNPVCENTPVLFTNLSVGGGEYYWDFGDGNYSTAFNPVHSYDSAGIYEVTLTVTDFGQNIEGGESSTACGCSDSITFTVEVLEGQGPIIESDCCDGTVCPGETSTFYTNVVCTTYNWSVTGGTIIAGAGTSQIEVEWDATYSVPTTVSLETPGCADTPCAGITTVGVPVLYPNLPISGDTNLCQGTNGTYSIPSMPGTYYTWTVSGGDYSINNSDLNSSHINVSFTSPGTFTIEVEYDNPLAGCSGSSSIVVEAKPVFFLFGEELVCEGSQELYVPNGDVSNWLVSPTGPTIDPIQQIAAEVTWNSAGTYLLTAEAADPSQYCNATAIKQVEVVSPPVLDPIDGPTVVCPDTYLTYFISSDTEGSFFNWSILPAGSGTIFSEMGADRDSIVVAFHGAGPWTLEVYQETEVSPGVTCISDIETLVVEAQAPPVISSQSNNTTVCVDAVETYFTALPVPIGGFTWEINPPNRGTIVSGQGTEEVEIRWHGPPANATLSVSSCAGADQIQLTIVNPPLIDPISADGPTLYCLPDSPNNLTLSTSLDPNFTYQWFENGQLMPGANTNEITISHPPNVASFIYVVEASNGSCTITREILVVIDDDCNGTPPTFECLLDFSINPDPACAGQPITLSVILPPATPPAINPGFYQFEWTFGDGSTSFTEETQKSFDAPGVYDITLIGYNNLCTLEVIKQVTVNPLPECPITATDTIFCPGDSLLLEACQGMTGYQWYREGNPIPGADQQTYWATQHGLYQVEATNQFGCSDLSEGVYIFSHSLPRAKISGEQSICVNPGWFFNMELSTPYDPDYSYEWSSSLAGATFNPNNGNNAASTNAQFQLPNPLPPQISFYVSVTDMTTGCVNTDTLCVTVNQIPFVEFTWQSACEGTPVTFTPSVIDTSQYHYLWSNGATTPEITVSTPGFYVLQITDKFSGCTFNAAAGMINPVPDVSLFPTGCETIEVDEVLDLYVPLPLSSTAWNNTIPIAYPSIEWFDTNGNSLGSGENLAFSSSTDGYFEVYAVIENVFGCEATTVVFCITVLPKPGDPEPAITVTKTLADINGTDQTAFTQVGDVLTYNIVVCNTGNVTLFNVVVEDPLTGMSETIQELAPGDCETFTTTYTITQGDLNSCNIRNVVTATGDDPDGNQVNDSDFVDVPCGEDAQNPNIEVTKTLANINEDPDQTAFTQVGDVLTYDIVVCNTGNVTLLNVLVEDPLTGLTGFIQELLPGDCETFTTSYTITMDDLNHCEVVNVVNASGNTQDDTQVVDSDEETVPCEEQFIPDPGLTVTKTLADINGNADQTEFTQVGDVLTFTIVVTNTGNVPLTNVVVDDPITGDNWTINVLNPGDSQTFTTTYTITQGELDSCTIRNVVTATGDDPDGNQVNDSDFVDVSCGEDAQNPNIEVTKTLANINEDPDQTAFTQVGDVLTYDIVVCNTGNVTLLNVFVEDPLTGLTGFIQELLPGDCETFTTSYTITMDDLNHCEVVNVVNASGNTQDDTQVVDSDEETVPCEEQFIPDPGLTVTKTLASINDDPNQTAFTQVGDILTFTIVVTNTGNVPLTNVVVDDPITGDTWTIPVLNPGDSQTFTTTYTITQGDLDSCTLRNIVTVTGEDPDGNQLDDIDIVTVPCDQEAQNPEIEVTKSLDNINGTDQTAFTQVGDVLTYNIVVCNTGNVTLFNVVVEDPLTGMSETIQELAPGDCETFTTSYTITIDDLNHCEVVNVVDASGNTQDGTPVVDTDEETVPCEEQFIPNPGLTVTKTLASINDDPNQTAFTQVGDILTFTIVVTNTGNVPLTNVFINDPVTGDSWTITMLNPGDSQTLTTTYIITQGDLDSCTLRNIVTVTGEDPDGNQLDDIDIVTVPCDQEAQNPEIEVTKSLDNINGTDQTAFTQVGDVLTYNIVVCNTGNVTLFNVVVEDPLTGMSETIQELAPGDCETFTTSYTITIDDLSHCEVVNVVDASGNTQDGTQVVDTDEETVPCEDPFVPEPGLTVTKTLASINDDPNQTAFTQVGDILTFTIVVTNTGNVPLNNVVVDDPVTGDTWTIPVLNPGDSQTFTTTYTITQGELDNCVIRNFVNATGDDPDGNQVSDGDVISVPCDPEGQDPDISVTKNLSDINGDSSITSYTQVGDVLTYTIVVTNTGSVTLFNVVVTDPLTGLSQNIPVMAPGDSVTLTTSYTITQADLDNGYVLNTVTAVGQDQFGNTVSDDDFEIVPGCIEELHPQLTVNKVLSYINESADQTNFTQVGDVLIYTITVVNTGNITLTNVVITDPMTGLNYTVPGSLAPGDSVSVTTSYTIQQFDLDKCFLLNLGYATGEDPYGFVVSHGDFEIVECEEDTGLYDFGDAPEGAIAYPPSTIGFFPTCTNSGPPGSFIRHSGNHELFFGESVDYEFDGNAGNCPTFSPNLYDQDECFEDGDAGLIAPRAYTITGPVGSESIVPCTAGWSWLTWFTCSQAVWGRTVDIYVTNNLPNGATAYVNLLVDWNMSGEWGGAVPCSGNNLAHEHALVNFPVPNGFSGPLSQLSPPNFRIGPEAGYVWTRFSVTDTPVVQDWDGSGSFDFGETEDYLIRTRPLIVIPVDWVIGGVSVALGEEVCFSALDNIVAGGEEGPFVVENGGFAELGAGRSISLQPGVRVEAGGYLHARIVTDDDYCIWEEGLDMATEPVGPAETVEEEDIPVSEPLELPEVFGFNVFPNPTTGTLNIELLTHSDSQSIRIEIYNMMGERVFWKEEAVASHYELDLSSQPPGMYFIRVSDGTATETQRVVRR